jgi:hypothetical protein
MNGRYLALVLIGFTVGFLSGIVAVLLVIAQQYRAV